MGIISGALAGAGRAMQQIGSDNMKFDREMESKAADSNMALERAKALEAYRQNLAASGADTQRTAQVARIDTASGKIADVQVEKRRGIVQGNIADPTAWTPEQQAAVDQALAGDRQAIVADPKTRTQAAIATGDIDPKTAATFGQKDDALLYKTLYEQAKEEGRDRRADAAIESREKTAQARLDSQNRNSDARLDVMLKRIEKSGSGGGNPTKEALSFIDGARKEVASEAANLKALYAAELKDASRTRQAEIKAEYAPKFAEVEVRRTQIQEDFNNLRERVGLPKAGGASTPAPAAPKPASSPASPAAKPAGRPPLSNFMKN